jgi:hypothetical protein
LIEVLLLACCGRVLVLVRFEIKEKFAWISLRLKQPQTRPLSNGLAFVTIEGPEMLRYLADYDGGLPSLSALRPSLRDGVPCKLKRPMYQRPAECSLMPLATSENCSSKALPE